MLPRPPPPHPSLSLTGTLPDTLASTNYLTTVRLAGNALHGTVPQALALSTQLTSLDLSDNPWIVGTLPEMR